MNCFAVYSSNRIVLGVDVTHNISIGRGTRISREMKSKLENMIVSGATVPSLSHYVRYASLKFPGACIELTEYEDSSIHGRLATIPLLLTTCIGILITPSKVGTVPSINTPFST